MTGSPSSLTQPLLWSFCCICSASVGQVCTTPFKHPAVTGAPLRSGTTGLDVYKEPLHVVGQTHPPLSLRKHRHSQRKQKMWTSEGLRMLGGGDTKRPQHHRGVQTTWRLMGRRRENADDSEGQTNTERGGGDPKESSALAFSRSIESALQPLGFGMDASRRRDMVVHKAHHRLQTGNSFQSAPCERDVCADGGEAAKEGHICKKRPYRRRPQ